MRLRRRRDLNADSSSVWRRPLLENFQCVFALSSSSPSSPRALPPPTSLTWRPIKCGGFIKYNKEAVGNLMVWLSGYYTGEGDEAVIDFDKIAADGQKLSAYCAQNPSVSLLTAAESIISKQ